MTETGHERPLGPSRNISAYAPIADM